MANTHTLGKAIEDYSSGNHQDYFYAIRRNEDGDLFLCRVNLTDNNETVDLFGDSMPGEFEGMEFPGTDYHDNRSALTKELEYPTTDVKYEQWRWDKKFISYYINSDGEFVAAINKDIPLQTVESIIPQSDTVTINIYGLYTEANIYDILIENGWNGISSVVLVNNGTISSNSPDTAALTISGNFPNGLWIENAGTITGAPGFIGENSTVVEPGVGIEVLSPVAELQNNSNGLITGGLNPFYGGYQIGILNSDLITTITNYGTISED